MRETPTKKTLFADDEREDGIARKTQKRFVFITTTSRSRKVKVKMHKKRVSNCHTHKKLFTKRNMPPKNAPSLRPTAAAALLSLAALFCVTVELAFARETQYFYNSVTGEVLYCGEPLEVWR